MKTYNLTLTVYTTDKEPIKVGSFEVHDKSIEELEKGTKFNIEFENPLKEGTYTIEVKSEKIKELLFKQNYNVSEKGWEPSK